MRLTSPGARTTRTSDGDGVAGLGLGHVSTAEVDGRVEHTLRPLPPAGLHDRRPATRSSHRDLAGEHRAARWTPAHIEESRLVVTLGPGEEAVPLPRAEGRPRRDGPDVDAFRGKRIGVRQGPPPPRPSIDSRPPEVDLGQGDGVPIPVPGAEDRL